MNARFFRTEALWEVDHVNELGIVLNSNFNINDRCPGYKTVKGTFNITNEIFLPFKLHSVSSKLKITSRIKINFLQGKGTVGVKAINKFNELLLCLKIPVLIIEDYVELNEEKICPEKL